MVELLPGVAIVGAVSVAILVPFLLIPEILERRGHRPSSAFVRGVVWASFLAIVLVPAVVTGFILTITNLADWFLFVVALFVAILYDYYRLNPTKIPRLRRHI